MPPNTAAYVKLEQRLVLLSWLNSLLGYTSNKELLAAFEDVDEGFDPSGRSYAYHRLKSREDKLQLSLQQLASYDDNIRRHVDAINAKRDTRITLRYFQYLALLYTEILLDFSFNRPALLLAALNKYVAARNANARRGDPEVAPFTTADLSKFAFWMATGSGKTLLMHINYRQFLHYNTAELDNIVLITPNEGLSEQHIEEMSLSGIPCKRFDLNESGTLLGDPNTTRVIEITKLVPEKRGGGVSVPIEAFEGNNLILVDEGHKGTGGKAWRGYRDALAQTGFTFEYSATFGQALTAARADELTEEYGKAIAFDYSYRYFHGDGFGKDFRIVNLKEETGDEASELLLLGNLLSYYEQLRCFAEQGNEIVPYNIEAPLWVFVGSTVSVYSEGGTTRSDVLTVVQFFNRFLENKANWSLKGIKKLLDGKTGIRDRHGTDVFADRFAYLQAAGDTPDIIYRSILRDVFHTPGRSSLHVAEMRGQTGELGLKAGGAQQYFGVIYIGDTPAFMKLLEAEADGIQVEEDAISSSLFSDINHSASRINVLIGAKKFMEGWNSWRVASMGLLNIGRKEGSQIIQLFGRGVRLKGKGHSLRRSSVLPGAHPDHIGILESLNIFAVRANYMGQFREYLEREGVEPEGYVELPLAIRPNQAFLKERLAVPRLPDGVTFSRDASIALEVDPSVCVTVDLTVKVQAMESTGSGLAVSTAQAGTRVELSTELLDLVDWERVYFDLLAFKEEKGLANLLILRPQLRRIAEHTDPTLCTLVADESLGAFDDFHASQRLTGAVASLLKKYAETFYRRHQSKWDSEHMAFRVMEATDPNFQDYTIKVPRTEDALINAVEALIKEGKRIYSQDTKELPNVHFDRHLYQPLLVERSDGKDVKTLPPLLEDSETMFVKALREYVKNESKKALANKEIFLLRNLSKGKGVGFFETAGFYPDFILWIKEGKKQRIVFVEPHGMRHEKAYLADEKALLHRRLQELSPTFAKRSGMNHVTMDSFIISATPFDELREYYGDGTWDRARFEAAHILFLERTAGYDYVPKLFA